jgi:hypothetical protein
MKSSCLVLVAALCAATAGCGSKGASPDDPSAPSAPPLAQELSRAAKEPGTDVVPDPHSPSRVLGYIEGDVITYREVLQLIGAELAQIDDPREKSDREDRAFLEIARKRLLYRAATDAGVTATRDEIETQRTAFVKDLAKNGGTLDAYLHEHEMSRREFDDFIRQDLIVTKFRRATIGHSGDPSVRVRPITDTYVSPEEVQKYHDRHLEKFHEMPSARCRMLAVKTDLDAADREKAVAAAHATAEVILARLKAGEDWVPVYRSAIALMAGTSDPDQLDGLVDLHRKEKADWIEEFAFDSEKGTLSPVIQKGTTFWILRAEGAHGERQRPFEDVAPDIRRLLSEYKAMMAWLEVEMKILDESSVQPDSLRTRIRETLRVQRLKLLAEAGL